MAKKQLVRFSVGFYEESVEDKILLTYIEMLVGDNKAERGNLLKNMALNYLKTQKPNTFNELKEILGNKVEEKKEKFSLTIKDEESKKRLESLMMVEKRSAVIENNDIDSQDLEGIKEFYANSNEINKSNEKVESTIKEEIRKENKKEFVEEKVEKNIETKEKPVKKKTGEFLINEL